MNEVRNSVSCNKMNALTALRSRLKFSQDQRGSGEKGFNVPSGSGAVAVVVGGAPSGVPLTMEGTFQA